MGWFCLAVWVLAMVAIAAPAMIAALRNVRRSRGRWGDRVRIHEPESDGPYREASTTERVPRRTPLSVWVMAIAGPVWASITILFIAPSYGLLTVAGYCGNIDWEGPPCEVSATLHTGFALGGAVLVLSGIVLGILLIWTAIALATAGAAELRASRISARFGAVHHAAVLGWWATASVAHNDLDSLPVIAVPCAVGGLVALLQWRASAHVARSLASAGAEHAEAAGGQAE